MAAARGHVDCMAHVAGRVGEDLAAYAAPSPAHVLDDFLSGCRSGRIDFSQELKANVDKNISKYFLTRRVNILGIDSARDLVSFISKEHEQKSHLNYVNIRNTIEDEIKKLLKLVQELDSRFKGKLVHFTAKHKLDYLLQDEFEFIYEVEVAQGGDSCVSVAENNNEVVRDGDGAVPVPPTALQDLFVGTHFVEAFHRACEQALRDARFSCLWPVPPFVQLSGSGTKVFAVCQAGGAHVLAAAHITPVLKGGSLKSCVVFFIGYRKFHQIRNMMSIMLIFQSFQSHDYKCII